MRIAVASGKGGTGKTTVATSLALSLSAQGQEVSFLDCDVEAPNAHLFLQPDFQSCRQVNRLIPEINAEICSACGRCAEVCQYHAIVVLGEKTLVFPELCHGCGSCNLECPENAIKEVPENLGVLEAGTTPEGIHFARGLLNIGEPMAVPVIHQLKEWQKSRPAGIAIWDSPPGTSCPVVESIRGADFLLLVTEPTPFGLHDLQLAAQLARELEISAGVVINRDGVGDTEVEEFCQQVGLPILMRIPLEREIGEGIARGKTLIQIRPEYKTRFHEMLSQIMAVLVAEAPR
jgi:MinD superfamily P-loop ATPase